MNQSSIFSILGCICMVVSLIIYVSCGEGAEGLDGWGIAQLVETDDTVPVWNPQVEVDGNGNAIAVWYYWSQNDVWANRYDVDTGWDTAQLIESNDGMAREPQIGVDKSGNAIAVWRQWDDSLSNIYSNRYIETTG
jgi:hypothetical protein